MLAIVLSLTMMVGVAGCGKEQQLEAEIDSDTPVSEVQLCYAAGSDRTGWYAEYYKTEQQ